MAPRAKGMERQRHRACEVDAHQEGRQQKSERESDNAAEGTIFEKKMAVASSLSFPKKPTRKSRVTAPGSCGTTCATQSAAIAYSCFLEVLEIST